MPRRATSPEREHRRQDERGSPGLRDRRSRGRVPVTAFARKASQRWLMADRDGWHPGAYDLWFTYNPIQAAIRRREQAAVWAALDHRLEPGDRVLEAGAGTGIYTRELARRGAAVVAIDASPAMTEHLDATFAHDPRIEVLHGSLPDAMPELAGCDGALAVGVLNYRPDLAGSLTALADAVRPGGWIVVTIPLRSPGGALYRAGEALTRRRVWLHTPQSTRAAALRANIEPEEIHAVGLSRRGFVLLFAGRRRD